MPRAGQEPASWHRPNRSWKDLREPARAKIPSSAQQGRAQPPLAKGCPGSLFPVGAEWGLDPCGWGQPDVAGAWCCIWGAPGVLPRGATALGRCLDWVTPWPPPIGATTVKVTPTPPLMPG